MQGFSYICNAVAGRAAGNALKKRKIKTHFRENGMDMEKYDFDRIIDRRGTGTVKYGLLKRNFGRDDLLPLWVADMDFETPPCVVEAIGRRMAHKVFGYTLTPETLWDATADWLLARHGWRVEREWLTYIPGIVRGIGMALNVFTAPGDKVIIQPPVYHPFRQVAEGNGREVVCNPLRELPGGSYAMDFGHLERVIDERCKVLILSNPHNPGGIVWGRETLARLAGICHRRGILVISDEIHADMTLWGNRHVPFAAVSAEAAACSITFAAPSKTFNIAGIVSSYAVVPDARLRRRFYGWLTANELNEPALFAPVATIAAFRHGEPWREQMLRYVEGNVDLVLSFCAGHLPQIRPWRPQASFLVWLDCRALGLGHDALVDLFVNRARLALNDGAMFGQEGSGFMRLNVGAPRAIVARALEQLAQAVAAG